MPQLEANGFQNLFSSALGMELLRSLQEDLHDNLVREAESSDNITESARLRLLNNAQGVTKAIAHLQFLAAVPTDEGDKVN